MKTLIAARPLAEAVIACAACLEKDPLRHHPGRLSLGHDAGALVLATSTRSGRVRMSFRIPCSPGATWSVLLDSDTASRLARALRPFGTAKANGAAQLQLQRLDQSLAVLAGVQRLTFPVREPELEDAPVVETVTDVVAADLSARIAGAMAFTSAGDYRSIAKGPFLYFAQAGGGLAVSVVVGTDGHRLFVDGDARDGTGADTVLQVAGEDWKPAAKAMGTRFDTVELARAPTRRTGQDGAGPEQARQPTFLVFRSADRSVHLAAAEPETTLPRWSGFLLDRHEDSDLVVRCERDALAAAVKAVSVVGTRRNAACMLRGLRERGILQVCVQVDDGAVVRQDVAADVHRAPAGYLHLNGRYLQDALAAVRTPTVQLLQHATPLDAVRLVEVGSEAGDLRPRGIVIMPIRGHDPVEEDTSTELEEPTTTAAATDHAQETCGEPLSAPPA
ncbi:MAG: hypothetical protein JXB32_14850 [Deltaproteobacteria bacterium]|nr:hypothetical protein [Deltaproteobacteria bacterium]